jgi:hypothetical protein
VVLQFDGDTEEPAFGFLDVADRTRTARIPVGDEYEVMRESFFDSFLAVAWGEHDDSDRVLDAATLQIAVHAALDTGETVTPGGELLSEYHADGTAYATLYASDKAAAMNGEY